MSATAWRACVALVPDGNSKTSARSKGFVKRTGGLQAWLELAAEGAAAIPFAVLVTTEWMAARELARADCPGIVAR
jgi:hypothetical protein